MLDINNLLDWMLDDLIELSADTTAAAQDDHTRGQAAGVDDSLVLVRRWVKRIRTTNQPTFTARGAGPYGRAADPS